MFNFEGGCYAKAIKLSREAEPEIYSTTERFGTVMENVALDPELRMPDFDDNSKTENTRIAYPLHFIANASPTGRAGQPRNVIMLTCDAFGVLPPIAKLDPAQAMYHFLSGYTAKVAGTEKGVTEPQATFSTCFGAPFMPLHPTVYGNLLRDLVARHHVDCWLVNTGWTGGKVGDGRRMPIRVTRRLLSAALDGSLHKAAFRTDPHFGLAVPRAGPRRRAAYPRSDQDLARQGRIRRDGRTAGADVPRQFQEIRGRYRRAGPQRRSDAAHRAGSDAHSVAERRGSLWVLAPGRESAQGGLRQDRRRARKKAGWNEPPGPLSHAPPVRTTSPPAPRSVRALRQRRRQAHASSRLRAEASSPLTPTAPRRVSVVGS